MNSDTTVLHIKNMVCPRCIKVVREELVALGLEVSSVELSNALFSRPLSPSDLQNIKKRLEENGFALLEDKKEVIVERIKLVLVDLIRNGELSEINVNLSQRISELLALDYSYLSKLFTANEGKSIERYTIELKTEHIKELIQDGELSIKQIADQMGYSSLQALSSQFKKETGLTPSQFKSGADQQDRKPLDAL